MAYQNALRWKIEDNEACAKAAVRVLMAWANTTTLVTGTSDACLAVGLYGYQFAQAAELMRDYEGWSREDFAAFQQWMLRVWYRPAIGFLRARNGTWENSGKWWQAPGHYWSNWGLCNALCVASIGVLCDDVFIYNQGMSFFKYDQVGTFRDPRTETPIKNDGLTEFLGNLVVTTSESNLETGAYGRLGQMNESGRDTGHPAMALGLAVDLAHLAYNQGDDMFAYMDHRLAAGIEYIAAQVLGTEGLPWTNYSYGTNGVYYTDSRCWTMTEPCMGVQIRPCWGAVIGHYEGVKGVTMPFSEQVLTKMGIDGGGAGAVSGGYDQLGYSVLMNTRNEQLCPAGRVPTELQGYIEYNGTLLKQSDLGGLKNTFQNSGTTSAYAKGRTVTLKPQLPEGEENTGLWLWDTGETTQELHVQTDRSQVYRVTYTNKNGVRSQQAFSIAVAGDCLAQPGVKTVIKLDGNVIGSEQAKVSAGSRVVLSLEGTGYCSWQWEDGSTADTYTTGYIVRDRDYYVIVTNQGGARSLHKVSIRVKSAEEDITGLIACYDFETEDTDGKFPSTVGIAGAAALRGTATWQYMADNNYAVFTGSGNGYIDLGAAFGQDIMTQLAANYTISLDLCITTPNSLSSYCWAWAFSNGTGQYSAMVNKAGNTDWYYELKDGTASQTNSRSSLPVNKWHTLTVVQNGTNCTFYIDGVQKATSAISQKPGTFGYALDNNWLGRSPYTSDAYMTNTYMDNLRVYNVALSAAEVKDLADSRPITKEKGDPTGVCQIVYEDLRPGTGVYDLLGRRIANAEKIPSLSKGLYIIDGKKILVR